MSAPRAYCIATRLVADGGPLLVEMPCGAAREMVQLSSPLKPLLMAAHFAYALQGEKRSESAPQAARFVTARIAGVPNAGQCGTISSVSAESCRGAAKPALRDFMRA